jgi:UDP-N-acetyl-alpha-D-muramoyl-L-alanyl-L-glutamate epimerase
VTRPERASTFSYEHVDVDAVAGTISCHYRSDDVTFTETAQFDRSVDLGTVGVEGGALLYFLLAGLSYYKTGAAHVVNLADVYLGPNNDLVTAAIRGGLAEFAYRSGLDLSDVELVGEHPEGGGGFELATPTLGPLIPFGGGIDSIVTVTENDERDAALFVVGPRAARFEAIERPAARTGLAVVRCTRSLDAKVLESRGRFYDGHVPVTAMVSALAICAGIAQGRRSVVMSNELSASAPNLVVDGRGINHQWSKSWEAEQLLRTWLAAEFHNPIEYYSALRDRSELWIAQSFAAHSEYFDAFMSCNRAFRQDPATRATTWCGACDKCLFIDLVLAPFVERARLEELFAGREPIVDPTRSKDLEVLVGLTDNPKPFECVGDAEECATALVAAASRPDRVGQPQLQALARRCAAARPISELLERAGPTNAPVRDAARDLL